jgi:hypothetical protein
MTTTINGSFVWGADDSLFEIKFDADVDKQEKVVTSMHLHLKPDHLDRILQDVYKTGEQEALRLALKQEANES